MGKKKVIIDTNVLISALGWGGKAYKIVDLGLKKSFRWMSSNPIFDEFIRTLNYPKLDFIPSGNKTDFISAVSEIVELVEVGSTLGKNFVDPDDIKFLECALETNADYLVSGDKHLLSLKNIGNTQILPPAKFLLKYYAHPRH